MAARILALLLVAVTACSVNSSTSSQPGGTSSSGSGTSSGSSGTSSGTSSGSSGTSSGTSSGSSGSSSGTSSGSSGGAPCAPDVPTFEKQVWQPVFAFKCAICHAKTGVAAGKRMEFVTGPEAGAGEKNLAAATVVAIASEEGEPLLLRRATGTTHTGGKVIQPGDSDYQRLATFVGRVRGDAAACEAAKTPACVPGDPGPRLIRRLSRAELDTTLRDVLGITTGYAATLVPDVTVHGFDNNAAALVVTPLLAEQLRNAAEEIGQTVAARAEHACSGDAATCARTFLQGKGARLLRRPATDVEVARWTKVYEAGVARPVAGLSASQSGLATMIAALLQSPAFLYRAELGARDAATGRYVLDSYEIASELSYMLWAAPPDDLLWAAAKADELRDPANIAAQAARLMASDRARASIARFTLQWLTSEQIGIAKKDSTVYPELTEAVRVGMAEELGRLAAAYTLDGSTLAALFTAPDTWVDAGLASYYGLPAPTTTDSSGFGRVTSGRGGLLGTGAVLTVHGQPNSSSPISRGKLVREQILCQVLPIPPSGVVAQPPAMDPSMTTRQRYNEHSKNPACYSCHILVDPLGFGFEHYDGIGRYRANENGTAVDDSGEILATASTNAKFSGVDGLSKLLGASTEVQDCFALQWLRWAYGLSEGTQTQCLVEDVQAEFKTKKTVIKDLLVALTQSSHFRARVADAASSSGGSSSGSSSGTSSGSSSGTSSGSSSGTSSGSSSGTSSGSSSGTSSGSSSGTSSGSSSGTSSGSSSGTSSGSSSGTSSGSSSGGSTDTPGVTATEERYSQWATGYCAKVVISNTTSAPVTWRVTLPVGGTINNHWKCQMSGTSGQVTFTGESYNATVAGGATTDFGYCTAL